MPPSPVLPLANLCVLVVEDMPGELRLLARLLGESGARVLMAVDGQEALRLAQLMRPDLLIMDVCLPPPDGLAVCRALQQQPGCADMPVIFISGLTDVATKLAAFEAGARDYLTKPFAEAELLARVALHARLGQRLRTQQPDTGLPRWLARCIQRLHTTLANPPGVEALAQEVGSTVSAVQEGFRTHLCTTPAAFLREARLTEAARLLNDTTTPVAEVGAAVGYPSPANFATAFKERFGMTPRQYRQTPTPPSAASDSAGPVA